MNLLRYLFSKQFIINVALGVAFLVACFYGVFYYMNVYTLHNQTIDVPNIQGEKIDVATTILEENNLNIYVYDSLYDPSLPPLTVVTQNPEPNFLVKKDRKIYVTINSAEPPKVKAPILKDLSLKYGLQKLRSYGFELDSIRYVFGEGANVVVDVEYNGIALTGTEFLPKGTPLVMVVSKGLGDETIPTPYLINMDLETAKITLTDRGLGLLVIEYSDCEAEEDSLEAKIYKQIPEFDINSSVPLGKTIHVFLTCDSTKIETINVDSILQLRIGNVDSLMLQNP